MYIRALDLRPWILDSTLWMALAIHTHVDLPCFMSLVSLQFSLALSIASAHLSLSNILSSPLILSLVRWSYPVVKPQYRY